MWNLELMYESNYDDKEMQTYYLYIFMMFSVFYSVKTQKNEKTQKTLVFWVISKKPGYLGFFEKNRVFSHPVK